MVCRQMPPGELASTGIKRTRKSFMRLSIARTSARDQLRCPFILAPLGRISMASRVWLGVTGADREGKATLLQVVPDGPAAKAGLKEGDVVVAIEGKEIDDYDKLLEAVRGKDAGDKVALKIARGSETLDVSVN